MPLLGRRLTRCRPPALPQAQAAEAEEAQRKHRPGRGSSCAIERKRVKAAREARETRDVEPVVGRQREAVGQVDREAAVERRELAD